MNTGSFASMIGGSDQIRKAMEQRGVMGPMDQVSPSAAVPGGSPVPAPSGPAPAPQPAPAPMGMGGPTSETELIVRALNDRMKSLSKIEEASSIPPKVTGSF